MAGSWGARFSTRDRLWTVECAAGRSTGGSSSSSSAMAAASAAVPAGLAADESAPAGTGGKGAPGWAGYDKALIVDALGSPGGSSTGENDASLSAGRDRRYPRLGRHRPSTSPSRPVGGGPDVFCGDVRAHRLLGAGDRQPSRLSAQGEVGRRSRPRQVERPAGHHLRLSRMRHRSAKISTGSRSSAASACASSSSPTTGAIFWATAVWSPATPV